MLKTNRKTLVIMFAAIYVFSTMVYTGSVKGSGTVMALDPSAYTAHQVGETFTINITITNVQNLWSWKARVTWDPTVLSLLNSPVEGPFLKSVGATLFLSTPMPPQNGVMKEISCSILTVAGATGSGVLATLNFTINKVPIQSPITLSTTVLLGPLTGDPPTHPNIDHEVQSATVQKFTANAGVDQTVNEDTQVTLNASKTNPQGQDYTFVWTFNDKEPKTLTGIIATYIFKTPGIYPVTLTVTDSEGNTSTDETIITVKDVTLPVAVITLEGITQGQTIDVGQKITFNGTKSYDPEDGTIQSYSWGFGDGETSSSPSVSHQYDKAGTYTVILNATDARGNNKNSATATVTIVQTQSTQIIAIIVAIVAIGIVGAGSAIWLMRRKKRS